MSKTTYLSCRDVFLSFVWKVKRGLICLFTLHHRQPSSRRTTPLKWTSFRSNIPEPVGPLCRLHSRIGATSPSGWTFVASADSSLIFTLLSEKFKDFLSWKLCKQAGVDLGGPERSIVETPRLSRVFLGTPEQCCESGPIRIPKKVINDNFFVFLVKGTDGGERPWQILKCF